MNKITFLFFTLLFSINLLAQQTVVTSFVLVNADTDTDILEITEGMEINLLDYPNTQFNIRANANGPVKSVRLRLFGALSGAMTENFAPYALFGDASGNFNGRNFVPGTYRMEATPHNAPNLGGVAGSDLNINFKMVDMQQHRPFITTWKTDNLGSSQDNQITIPTFPGETYNYTVDWGDGTSDSGVKGNITHTYEISGIYEVSISGNFPRIYFNNSDDKEKVLTINQWGDINWYDMSYAFYGCINLDISASDTPEFSQVASTAYMFAKCSSLIGNPSFSLWNVSQIWIMEYMFEGAILFNQNIGSWDVGNVAIMSGMFSEAETFNKDLSLWNTQNVTAMSAMFRNAKSFEGTGLEFWNVDRVMDMTSMFKEANSFEGYLEQWNVSSVNNMGGMFDGASLFNSNISNWDVSNVEDMQFMFSRASNFNQNISGWDVNNVNFMLFMFQSAESFNQDLGNWNVAKVMDMDGMFNRTSLSKENYDSLLNGWSTLQLQNGVTFDAGNSQYCQGEEARQNLIDDFGWTITDKGRTEDCIDSMAFITTWKTDNPGLSNDNQITISTDPARTYNYDIDWGDGNRNVGVTGDIVHSYAAQGIYQISISGTFPRFCFKCDEGGTSSTKDRNKIIFVNQWGDIEWKSMERAFEICTNLDVVAQDVPDLSKVTSLRRMFGACNTLVGNPKFNDWDVSGIENFSNMFSGATNFDQPLENWSMSNAKDLSSMFSESGFNQSIRNWDVSGVLSMSSMFHRTSFNQDLSTWNVGSVIQMQNMFTRSSFNQDISNWNVSSVQAIFRMFKESDFNQDISGWNVGSVIDFSEMFQGNTVFNQDLSSWNVSAGQYYNHMFEGAEAFNQDLGQWNVSEALLMNSFIDNSGMSSESYGKTLVGWSTLPTLQNDVPLGAANLSFCNAIQERQHILDTYGWRIIDAGTDLSCNDAVVVPLYLNAGGVETFNDPKTFVKDNYYVNGQTFTNTSANVPELYQTERFSADKVFDYGFSIENGEYLVRLHFAEIYWGATGGAPGGAGKRVFDVMIEDQVELDDYDVFADVGAETPVTKEFLVTVNDGILSINFDSSGLNGVGEPKISAIEVLEAPAPQRPFVTTWKTDNPGTSEDNQITIKIDENNGFVYNYTVDWGDGTNSVGLTGEIIHSYETPGIYQIAITGNFPAIKFLNNGDKNKILSIDQWGELEWEYMFHAFSGCENLDMIATDIPDFSNVEIFQYMFYRCTSLIGNESMNSWDMSKARSMDFVFWGAESFDRDISNWNVSNVIGMRGLFQGAKSFNQNINNWNVHKVQDMTRVFWQAESFDQNLKDWDISRVNVLDNIFDETSLSQENYDAILIGWSTIDPNEVEIPNNLNLGAENATYCLAEKHRQKLIDDFGWTITDGGRALDCNPCPTTLVTLSTQQQVDDFATNYDVANCRFEGGILIEGRDVTNLDGLSALTDIQGSRFLHIINTSLINVDGLSSITKSSNLVISDNSLLTNINGLASLTHVGSDLVIQNNVSLTNLDGLSSLLAITDSFIIKNNASLTNLDGLSSLVFLDNDLVIELNPALTNVDGLSNLNAVGISLSIQSNAALTNLNGLSAITKMFGDLSIIDNNSLINILGLSNLDSIGQSLIISDNDLLSDCAIDAVCDSDTIVGGMVTISGNTGNCMDKISALEACVDFVEGNADILAATYLQGSRNPEPTGPILRVEEGNRETYLKFDMSGFTGNVTEARLEMQVASDPGHGIIEVFLGSNSNWTETDLNGSNKPSSVGSALASISGTHSLGQTKVWNLGVANLTTGEELTLIVKHSNGNDVAFASDESNLAPKLFITSAIIPEVPRPFITTWKTDNPGITAANQIKIPAHSNISYDYDVDWGDGSTNIDVTGEIVHTYASPGIYTVKLSGNFPISFQTEKLLSVDQWGVGSLGIIPSFSGCVNMDVLATDSPNFSNTNSVENMFANCTSLIGNSTFNDWDVSSITEFDSMLKDAASFNQDISAWDVSNGSDMEDMFNGATAFNQDISTWDVSNAFTLLGMFDGASNFNQDISVWDVSNVYDFSYMFKGAINFNQDIGSWNMSNAFATYEMFHLAISFNQDIGNWDVSNVNYMQNMFDSAVSFDQDLGAWQIPNVINISGLFNDITLSSSNYDALLQGWSSQQLQNGLAFDGGNSQYCHGETARQKLIDDFDWIITDGGKLSDCNPIVVGEADLIEATYLQGSRNPEPTGPILRTEEGNRETYLKFDLNSFSGNITDAHLEMQVASDPGNGTLQVFMGSNSNWTETDLNGSNKPTILGNELASISGTHSLGQTKVWSLDVAGLSPRGELTLILKHSNGNDVAFASDETVNAPRLIITTGSTTSSGALLAGKRLNTLSLSPNPAVSDIQITFKSPEGEQLTNNDIQVYDVLGRMVLTVSSKEADVDGAFLLNVRSLESGIYFIKTYDENGIPYQKQMAIKR